MIGMRKHDKAHPGGGFNIDPEQLVHDLTIVKLSKMPELSAKTNEFVYYDAYVKLLDHFEAVVEDKIRYDSGFISE